MKKNKIKFLLTSILAVTFIGLAYVNNSQLHATTYNADGVACLSNGKCPSTRAESKRIDDWFSSFMNHRTYSRLTTIKNRSKSHKTIKKVSNGFIKYGKWTYYLSHGKKVKGMRTIRHNTYLFNSHGVMLKGLRNYKHNKFYFNNYGIMQKNKFIKYYSSKFYFDKQGKQVSNTMRTVNHWTYLFNGRGNVVKGLTNYKGATYLFNQNGIQVKGFANVKGLTYYFDKYGKQLKGNGVVYLNSKNYKLTNNVVKELNIQQIENTTNDSNLVGTQIKYDNDSHNLLTHDLKDNKKVKSIAVQYVNAVTNKQDATKFANELLEKGLDLNKFSILNISLEQTTNTN